MDLNQYQIVLVNLETIMESEIQKARPCLVISPNEINNNLRTVVIAPMTTASKPYPTRVKINHNSKTGWAVIDQIRTIDKSRIIKILGKVTKKEIEKRKSVLKETFVD